jgi:uncharacterized protein YjbJ (UPF0337 family)
VPGLRDRIIGSLKVAMGVLIGDEQLERAGRMDNLVGAVQGTVDEVVDEVSDVVIPIRSAAAAREEGRVVSPIGWGAQ